MLKSAALIIASCIFAAPLVQGQQMKSVGAGRPNVLFIAADDMNAYAFLKNYPVLKTPALDKLVSESYYFKNATCAAPCCIPSRASFWTGVSPHKTGSYFNVQTTWTNTLLSTTEVMPETFKKNGYETFARGKIFHLELNDNREDKMFDNKVLKGGYGPFSDDPADAYGPGRWMRVKPWEGPDTDFPDVRNANAAIEFLSQKHDKPFFMYYGLFRPHSPYTAPKRFFDLYKDSKFTLPPGYLEHDLNDVPEAGRDLVDSMLKIKRAGMSKKEVCLELMKAYCANYSFADWSIGRVLEALDKSEFAKNTIVIFISDNGFHNGTKDHWTKFTLWDQADVVPLLIRLPNGKAYKCPQTVSLIDIFPTLVEYCGIQGPPHQLDGKSIVPVLKDAKTNWNRNGFTYFGENYSAIRSERYRYIKYADGSEELYDHNTDPYEHKNIANEASAKKIKQELAKSIPSTFAASIGKKSKGGDE